MRHPEQDRILSFLSGRTTEDEAERLYEHLAECSACTRRLEALRALREDFEGSWDRFIDEYRTRAALLSQPEARRPAATLLLRGLMDGARRLAVAAADAAAAAVAPLETAFVPAYQGVGDAERSPELRRLVEEASRCLAEGDEATAMKRLEEVSGKDPEAARASRVDLLLGGRVAGRVTVDAGRRSVSVIVYPDVLSTTPEAVHLLDPSGLRPRIMARPEAVPGAPYLLAEFENVADGAFMVSLDFPAGS